MPLSSVALTAASEPSPAGGITLPPALLAAAPIVNVSFGAVASLSETYRPDTVVVPSPFSVTLNASVPMTGPAARLGDAFVALSAPTRVMVSGWLPVWP